MAPAQLRVFSGWPTAFTLAVSASVVHGGRFQRRLGADLASEAAALPEGAVCPKGINDNCRAGSVCGRYSRHRDRFQCCAAWMVHDGVTWCANPEGAACSDGVNENCASGMVCGSSRQSPSGFQCCSKFEAIEGVASCILHETISVSGATLLRQSPFLMTHDSATSYKGGHLTKANFVKTASASLVGQLACGARAFDLRVIVLNNNFDDIRFHHFNVKSNGKRGVGWVSRDQSVANTIPEMVSWSRMHPDELVLLSVNHCYITAAKKAKYNTPIHSLDCRDARLVQAFTKLGMRAETSCHRLNSWTLDKARQAAEMPGGGKMLFIPGDGICVQSNWDDSVHSAAAVDAYVDRTMQAARAGSPMFQVQAFSQQKLFVPLEKSKEINLNILRWLKTSDKLTGVNLLEVNLVCAYGPSIASALGAVVTPADRDMCRASCAEACKVLGTCSL
mmetsp:Transcript_71076/g.179925  ORF Transcript_71076/g.179925 Transcript_71076/m.179925 type:complete len:448 (+) Transcript_71076:80-1423(+)